MKNFDAMVKRYGLDVSLHLPDGWSSGIYQAFIQPLRYKNKLYLDGTHTDIGIALEGSYLYMGPANHDLTKLPSIAYLIDCEKQKYFISRSEKVYFGKDVAYIWAILKKFQEGEYE